MRKIAVLTSGGDAPGMNRLSGLYDALPAAAADYAAANEENMHRRKILGETVK